MSRYSPAATSGAASEPDDDPPNLGRRRPAPATTPATPPADPDPSSPSGFPEEEPLVLDEIDRIITEVRTRRNGIAAHAAPIPWAIPISGEPTAFGAASPAEREGMPSGYFEEHLDAARRAVGQIHEQVGELADTSSQLRQRVAAAEGELERIAEEYRFVRERSMSTDSQSGLDLAAPPWWEGEPEPVDASASGSKVGMTSGSFTAIRAASADGPTPVYAAYTVERYNRTVAALKHGRPRLVAWTLLLSAAVGIVLVLVMLYSPIVYPPIWVAVLPLVWVVPIPYFLLAFRGTHRVLQETPLSLPEAR